jgi:hypothetical protein
MSEPPSEPLATEVPLPQITPPPAASVIAARDASRACAPRRGSSTAPIPRQPAAHGRAVRRPATTPEAPLHQPIGFLALVVPAQNPAGAAPGTPAISDPGAGGSGQGRRAADPTPLERRDAGIATADLEGDGAGRKGLLQLADSRAGVLQRSVDEAGDWSCLSCDSVLANFPITHLSRPQSRKQPRCTLLRGVELLSSALRGTP